MAKKGGNGRDIFSLEGLSFIAVMLVGLSLLVSFILARIDTNLGNAVAIIERIGLAIAILVPILLSYRWARRTKTWVFVLWVIAVVIVVVFYVLSFIF